MGEPYRNHRRDERAHALFTNSSAVFRNSSVLRSAFVRTRTTSKRYLYRREEAAKRRAVDLLDCGDFGTDHLRDAQQRHGHRHDESALVRARCTALFQSMSMKSHLSLSTNLAAVLAAFATPVHAADPPAGVAVHGWLDGYYAWNSDHPEPKLNFFSGTGTTGHRADQLALNVAALDV